MRAIFAAVLIAGLLAFAGCDSEGGDATINNGSTGAPCGSDMDCKGDRICLANGKCSDPEGNSGSEVESGGKCAVDESGACASFDGTFEFVASTCDTQEFGQAFDAISFTHYADCTVSASGINYSGNAADHTDKDCFFACHEHEAVGNHLSVDKWGLDFVKCGNSIEFTVDGECKYTLERASGNTVDHNCECDEDF
jgi:hypothetical protein